MPYIDISLYIVDTTIVSETRFVYLLCLNFVVSQTWFAYSNRFASPASPVRGSRVEPRGVLGRVIGGGPGGILGGPGAYMFNGNQ